MAVTLTNRRILLGVSGGIAAYKSAELIRRLQDLGADVRVVMTRAAQEFITPLTLQALSGNPVHVDLLDPAAEAAMGHIELARWADVMIVAPASADVIARITQGNGNDLLTTACLARRCDLIIAPAMNEAMWHHQATQDNLALLNARGVHQIGPASGGQACGDVGMGRMSEPAVLAQEIAQHFDTGLLAGKSVVITAGPTREAIDPVRYISNHSSGKMGYALAQAAVDAGAKVTLISGPTALACPDRVHRIDVISAENMHQASMEQLDDCDIFIASAAVADFRPATIAEQKMKKTAADTMTINMVKNPDIVASVANASNKPFVIGFAAETHDVIAYAKDKLQRKNLDMIIANDVSDSTIGFNSDHNVVTILTKNSLVELPEASKHQLAITITEKIAHELSTKTAPVL
ncbi:MAG: phosphopantothenoylcysteine decarboxylase/phosphopantothenate--cysteine ligase [Candidatus Endobugula sp.]|jgi:phosphopantothenoylcysteine decarboxylase/phosphopantothenate--cysteine ligase